MATAVFFDTSLITSLPFRRVEKICGSSTLSMLVKLDMWLFAQPDHSYKNTHSTEMELADVLGFEQNDFEQFLDAAYEAELFIVEDGFVFSERVNAQIDGLKKRTKGLKGQKQEQEKTLRQRDDNVTLPSQDRIGLDRIGSDLKKEGGVGETVEVPKLPPKFDTSEVRAALRRWFSNLKTNHKREFDPIAYEALIASNMHKTPEKFAADLDHSTSNRWKNLIEKPMDEAEKVRVQAEERQRIKEKTEVRPKIPEYKPPPREKIDPAVQAKFKADVEALASKVAKNKAMEA